MVTVKKPTIQTKKFESEIVKLIKSVEKMDIPIEQRMKILDLLRALHNDCLEWGVPVENFKIIERRLP